MQITNNQLITVSASANATRHPGIHVKAANPNALTREAEQLRVEVLPRKERNVVLYAVTEENDDVRVIPPGQGQPNTVAYVFSPGPNGFIDTVAQGDDWLAPVPIGQRPPGYDARSRRVFTGENGILETMPQGDDEIFTSDDKEQLRLFAPISEFGTGQAEAVCVTSGPNRFLDTLPNPRSDDVERVDPNDPSLRVITAGPNGRCNTRAINTNIPPPNLPNAAALQNYLNNTTWGRQANIYFTVTVGTPFTVNFDLDRDGKLMVPLSGVPASFDETNEIRNGQSPQPQTINLYYVGVGFNNSSVLGVAYWPGQHVWLGLRSFDNNGALYTAAHEIGHALGSDHTYEPGPNPNPLDSDFQLYQNDLMFGGYLQGTVNQCRVREPQWRTAIH